MQEIKPPLHAKEKSKASSALDDTLSHHSAPEAGDEVHDWRLIFSYSGLQCCSAILLGYRGISARDVTKLYWTIRICVQIQMRRAPIKDVISFRLVGDGNVQSVKVLLLKPHPNQTSE